ncbi:MAG TPA: hypothetical protein VF192_12985 [Longimicrobiales bacterium]
MKYATHHLALALLLGMAACGADPTSSQSTETPNYASIQSEGVVFTAEPDHVVILNQRPEPIVYKVMDARFAALALWAPCARLDCPMIQPGETKRISKRDITGTGESDEVILFWWHLVRISDNKFRPDSLRAIRIPY